MEAFSAYVDIQRRLEAENQGVRGGLVAESFIQEILHYSLNNGYVEGSFITLLEPVSAPTDPKSVVRNFVAPRIL